METESVVERLLTRLENENERLKHQVSSLLGQREELQRINNKLCRQLREKEQLLAEVTRDVAKAQEQPKGNELLRSVGWTMDYREIEEEHRASESKVASRVIGTPKADDIEKALREEANSTSRRWASALQVRRLQEQGHCEIAEENAASARCEFLTENRVRQIVHEELSRAIHLED